MSTTKIPDIVIARLPIYLRALAYIANDGTQVTSSHEMGEHLGISPAQIRKDLSYFGRFGKQGRGYNIDNLLTRLQSILGLDREWRMALVGVGRLGRAILSYGGFRPQGFLFVKAYDADPVIIGRREGDLVVENVADLEASLRETPLDIGIVAVPGHMAQNVIDVLVQSNVRAILNYAPIAARVPSNVYVRQIDPVLALQSMTYFLTHSASERA